MFGTALRAAGDFVEESFASANSGADADGSVGGEDSAEVESLVAAAIKVAEENAAHFIDLGVGDEGAEGAEGADSGEAVDVDTAIELLDRVQGVLAAARGDFHAALDQSQQGAGVKAPGAPDGYLTAAQLLTLMGGMGAGGGGLASGLPVDENVGDPTVPGTKFPFNATDNTEELGNIADKVADDPLGYLNGLIDDLINPNRDGATEAATRWSARSRAPTTTRSEPIPRPSTSPPSTPCPTTTGPRLLNFSKRRRRRSRSRSPPSSSRAGSSRRTPPASRAGCSAAARPAPRAPETPETGGCSTPPGKPGRMERPARPPRSAPGGGRIVRRTSTSTKIEMSGSTASSNGGGGGGGGLASVRRGFRDLTSRAGEERRGGEADSRREGGGVSATLSTAAAARSVQMERTVHFDLG